MTRKSGALGGQRRGTASNNSAQQHTAPCAQPHATSNRHHQHHQQQHDLGNRLTVIIGIVLTCHITNTWLLDVAWPLTQTLLPVLHVVSVLGSPRRLSIPLAVVLVAEYVVWTTLCYYFVSVPVLAAVTSALMMGSGAEWLHLSGWSTLFVIAVSSYVESTYFAEYKLFVPIVWYTRLLMAQGTGFSLTLLLTNFGIAVTARGVMVMCVMSVCSWVLNIILYFPRLTYVITFTMLLALIPIRFALRAVKAHVWIGLYFARLLVEVAVGFPISAIAMLFTAVLGVTSAVLGVSAGKTSLLSGAFLVGVGVVELIMYYCASTLWLSSAYIALANAFLLMYCMTPTPQRELPTTLGGILSSPAFLRWCGLVTCEVALRMYFDLILFDSGAPRALVVNFVGYGTLVLLSAYTEVVWRQRRMDEAAQHQRRQMRSEQEAYLGNVTKTHHVSEAVKPNSGTQTPSTATTLPYGYAHSERPVQNLSDTSTKVAVAQQAPHQTSVTGKTTNAAAAPPPRAPKPETIKTKSNNKSQQEAAAASEFAEAEARRKARREREKEKRRQNQLKGLQSDKSADEEPAAPPPPPAPTPTPHCRPPPTQKTKSSAPPPPRRLDEARAEQLLRKIESEQRARRSQAVETVAASRRCAPNTTPTSKFTSTTNSPPSPPPPSRGTSLLQILSGAIHGNDPSASRRDSSVGGDDDDKGVSASTPCSSQSETTPTTADIDRFHGFAPHDGMVSNPFTFGLSGVFSFGGGNDDDDAVNGRRRGGMAPSRLSAPMPIGGGSSQGGPNADVESLLQSTTARGMQPDGFETLLRNLMGN
eukprot:PhM_4_TR553/c1_g1_i1/m.37370